MLTGEVATILSAVGSGSEWFLRLLYPNREACSEIHTVCKTYNLGLIVDSIRTIDGEQSTHHGLTDAQHMALAQAYNMGYFKVPRDTSLAAVAESLDISHQALSERLRRAHQTLIGTMIRQQGSAQTTTKTAPTDGSSSQTPMAMSWNCRNLTGSSDALLSSFRKIVY
ncbi:helix-turn-helix domain-containing protein [Halocatena salina]|uniref:helix-turn-helix domain-containing protein n=1 Tax=Halocatena salina TaxID=2934340 RepID=UPI0024946B7E|nr:helix-turn-helix domain-containing protein [Halocatena salina]